MKFTRAEYDVKSADAGVFGTDPYKAEAIAFATKKQITPEWHQIFLRGIGCNWLVCLACYLGMQGRDLASKVMGIWWPIFAFVSLGLDHVVANMFFIPLGIWVKTPGLTVGLYIWKGIIPAGLGNIVGGALFCGAYYWWMYLFMEEPVVVDGVLYEKIARIEGMKFPYRLGREKGDEENGTPTKQVDISQEVTGRDDLPTIGG